MNVDSGNENTAGITNALLPSAWADDDDDQGEDEDQGDDEDG